MSQLVDHRGTPIYPGIQRMDYKRDLYKVAGLPPELDFTHFYSLFRRSGFARSAIMRPAKICWSTAPKIYDFSGDGEAEAQDTAFERAVKVLFDKHNLLNVLYSLDYRQSVGRYGGVILIGKEAGSATSKDALRVNGINNLVALRPVYEGQIRGNETEDDIQSIHFGNPKTYSFLPNEASTSTKSVKGSTTLHRSRVYVYAEGADDGSIYGTPRLECVFNAIMNLFKIQVAASEGFFKNARQRLHVDIRDETTAKQMMAQFTADKYSGGFRGAMNKFAAGWDAEFFTAGMDVKTLQTILSDPTGAANLCLQEIAAGLDIPKTILTGFETGERSSQENMKGWLDGLNSRRENDCTPMLKGMLNHLIEVGVLPEPKNDISVTWDDLNASSDTQKLELSKLMTDINKASIDAGMGEVFTPEEIRKSAGYEVNSEFGLDFDDREDGEGGGE